MYRSDGFLVPQVEKVRTGIYHDLAEAIRRGCVLRPKKVMGHFWRGKDGACALGAALVGAGKEPLRGNVYKAIVRVFPELNDVVAQPVIGTRQSLGWTISWLNDETQNSREAIADWLCVEGGCKHLDRPMIIKPARNTDVVVCDCSVCRGLGFVPDVRTSN
jgi:hypothetical protein